MIFSSLEFWNKFILKEKMKVLLIFALLAIAQPLFATQSLNQCFEEFDNELEEHEKSLEVGANQDLAGVEQRRGQFAGSNKDGVSSILDIPTFGAWTLVRDILQLVMELVKKIFTMIPDMITNPPADADQERALRKVLIKMVDLYQPFLVSNRKLKRILEKLSNKAQV